VKGRGAAEFNTTDDEPYIRFRRVFSDTWHQLRCNGGAALTAVALQSDQPSGRLGNQGYIGFRSDRAVRPPTCTSTTQSSSRSPRVPIGLCGSRVPAGPTGHTHGCAAEIGPGRKDGIYDRSVITRATEISFSGATSTDPEGMLFRAVVVGKRPGHDSSDAVCRDQLDIMWLIGTNLRWSYRPERTGSSDMDATARRTHLDAPRLFFCSRSPTLAPLRRPLTRVVPCRAQPGCAFVTLVGGVNRISHQVRQCTHPRHHWPNRALLSQ
jgi:hypothetical protein